MSDLPPKYELFASAGSSSAGSALGAVAQGVLTPIVSHTVLDGKNLALVTLQSNDASPTGRSPIDVVCVVDLSGSMDAAATLTTGGTGTKEDSGLTVLDVVKHAVKTVIMALEPNDRLGIVSFHDSAEIQMPLTSMDKINREAACTKVTSLETLGSTNIWAGLDFALDLIYEQPCPDSRLRAVLLFTDGQPNVRPPVGEVSMLEKRKAQKFNKKLPCIISTFGFGTSLDSGLLSDIASVGMGGFSFIPDAGFVGTVFVDAVSNLLAATAKDVVVTVEGVRGARVQLKDDTTSVGGHYRLGSPIVPTITFNNNPYGSDTRTYGSSTNLQTDSHIRFGFGSYMAPQSKDLVFVIENMPSSGEYLRVTVEHVPVRAPFGCAPVEAVVQQYQRKVNEPEVQVQWARLRAVDAISSARLLAGQKKSNDAAALVDQCIKDLEGVEHDGKRDDRINDLLIDIKGQVKEAISDKYILTWGGHYLLSLAGAHRMQQCNNFKDPGIQRYTGGTFDTLRDEINEIFLKLPAPKPRVRPHSGRSSNSNLSAPVSMSRFHNRSNPCFGGSNKVSVLLGKSKEGKNVFRNVPVAKLRRGDRVRISTTTEQTASVRCVLETYVPHSQDPPTLVQLQSGLVITPGHPIHFDGQWMYPADAFGAEYVTSTLNRVVYSLLLESDDDPSKKYASTVVVAGVECVTLAHGLEGEILSHEYLGTDRVVKDLQLLPGFNSTSGRVLCSGVRRDAVSGHVVGLVAPATLISQAQL
ncbi:hint-domain-containing protein [Zopfochytrium polystomum]|nr:hint-domain-containing protein [Zopfochytrium polystomum]